MTLVHEANAIANYLIKSEVDSDLISKYSNAINQLDTSLSQEDEKLFKLCIRKPFLLPLVDSGLALIEPFSTIRKRIYVMNCILEATPKYSNHYLPQTRSLNYLPLFIVKMGFTILESIAGYLFIKSYRYAQR